MKGIVLLVWLVISLVLPMKVAAEEEVVVATGITFIEKIFNPVKPRLADAGLVVRIVFADPIGALKSLEAGGAELAGASLDFESWLKEAAGKGYTVKDRGSLTPHVIVVEETVVIVNAANSVAALSKQQLQGIFSGRIQNWKEVGGSDLPILVVWPQVASGALVKFNSQIMDRQPVTKTVLDVASINDTAEAVAANVEAISIENIEKVTVGGKRIDAPVIKRELTLMHKGDLSPKVKKLLEYLRSEEARKLFR